jgi:Icc-related predicted phosphoesterase
MRILAVADEVDRRLYGAGLSERMAPDLIVGCGDLPGHYLDYLVSQLNAPLYAIHGNHDAPPTTEGASEFDAAGASWIGGRAVNVKGVLMAGFDGCVRYNRGAYQSTQTQMRASVGALVPWLWLNKLRYGRFLDVLITHAPPRGIHDQADPAHAGFDAFRWLIETFQPRYHLHGHVHVYDRRNVCVTQVGRTEVVNVYPYRELTLDVSESAVSGRNQTAA